MVNLGNLYETFLGKEGEKVENLTLTVLSVRLEDNPYKTQLKGTCNFTCVNRVYFVLPII